MAVELEDWEVHITTSKAWHFVEGLDLAAMVFNMNDHVGKIQFLSDNLKERSNDR
jgi:hypothetical protein